MPAFTDLLAQAERHLTACDPILAPLLARVGPCSLKPDSNSFGVLVRAVIAQLISTAAAKTISGRLAEALGRKRVTPEAILNLPEDTIRAAGLSRTKTHAIRDLAQRAVDGVLPLTRLKKLTDEEVAAHLTAVRGIGPWTVNMFLIFGLGRPDVFPVGDMGLRAALQECYGLPTLPGPSEMHERAECWRPFRSIGTWYMWRSRGFVPVVKKRP